MKQIKYRAYDKKAEWMTEVLCLNLGKNAEDHVVVRRGVEDQIYPQLFKNLKVMQWTGLKDKNNKDIYEGDIVKVITTPDNDLNPREMIGQVVFNHAEFRVKFPFATMLRRLANHQWIGNIEIIGNIYENKDLNK